MERGSDLMDQCNLRVYYLAACGMQGGCVFYFVRRLLLPGLETKMRLRKPVWLCAFALACILIIGNCIVNDVLRGVLSVLLVLSIVFVTWGMLLAPVLNPPRRSSKHNFVLESIPPSHFVEKVRWCLDLAGVSYVEVRTAPCLLRCHLLCHRR
jgi:hypothetical protein